MTRRDALKALAAVPLVGLVKPAEEAIPPVRYAHWNRAGEIIGYTWIDASGKFRLKLYREG